MFDPFAGAERLENGALLYVLQDKEISSSVHNEEKLREEFNKLKEGNQNIEAEDEDEVRIKIMEQMEENSPFSVDEFNEILDKEFSVFKNGEKYDYVKDLKSAYQEYSAKSTGERILETIPEHAFWDIKTPQVPDSIKFKNPYNPFRKYPWSSFFDMRDYEEYMR